MLVVLADYSDDAGNSYPGVASLARKCRMSSRNANYILKALQASGELRVLKNEGPKGTNRYRIMLAQLGMSPLKLASPHEARFTLKPTSATPEAGFPKPLKPTSDEPSLNRHEPSGGARKRATSTPKSKRATRLASDWTLPDDYRAFCKAERPELDADVVAQDFRDYWHAKAGADAAKRDWLATWRRWVRSEHQTRRCTTDSAVERRV